MSEEAEGDPTTSPIHMRCFILAQLTDYSEPPAQLVEKCEALYQWVWNGVPAKPPTKLQAVK